MNTLKVAVVLALPRWQQVLSLDVPVGTSIRQAAILAERQGLDCQVAAIDVSTVALGIYGVIVNDNYAVKANDRIEIYRPLAQDPKEWRRQQAMSNAKGKQ